MDSHCFNRKKIDYFLKIFIYFIYTREYDKKRFQISKSLNPYGTGEPFLRADLITRGVNPSR